MIYLGNLNPESPISEFARIKRNISRLHDRGFITDYEYLSSMQEWKAIVEERFRRHGYVRQG